MYNELSQLKVKRRIDFIISNNFAPVSIILFIRMELRTKLVYIGNCLILLYYF